MPSLRPFSLGYDKLKLLAEGGAGSAALWQTLVWPIQEARLLLHGDVVVPDVFRPGSPG